MEHIFTSKKKEKIKGSTARRALGIFLAAGMICNMLWTSGLTAQASELAPYTEFTGEEQEQMDIFRYLELYNAPSLDFLSPETEPAADGNTTEAYPYSAPAATASQGNLDFSSGGDAGVLETDHYHWDSANKKLSLKNANISGKVTLPDTAVTIETEGNCSINTLSAGESPQNTELTFSGKGLLTIENRINISGGNYHTLTVAAGAQVTINDGIAIGASGGTDSIVTVNGTLIAKGSESAAVSAGTVVVGAGGTLEVSGGSGVQLNGMTNTSTMMNYAGVFTIERRGCFNANCTAYNVKVVTSGSFPEGSNGDKAINVPDGYLPTDCWVRQNADTVDLVRKSTGDVYTGAMSIHENHIWSDVWKRDENNHWNECTYNGCDKRNNEAPHSYDSQGKCICGSTLSVTLSNGEGIVYNGQAKRPGVAVSLDGRALDASKYDITYSNNTNAGQGALTITGKGGLTFTWTAKFQIAKAAPTITWDDTAQTVIYSGSQAAITPPAVTLVNGESFKGQLTYSYAAQGSASYTAGLPTDAGVYTVRASIPEQGNYTAADSTNTLTLTVEKAEDAPNMPSRTMNVAKKYEKAGDVELPKGWQWQEADKNIALEIGVPVKAIAVYTGADKNNYKNVKCNVTITRSDCDHKNTELRNVVAATALKKGYSGDTYCLDCGELLTKGKEVDFTGSMGTGTAQAGSGGTGTDAVNKSPKTGQPWSSWQALGAGALAVLMGAGGFLAVRKKKEGNK